MKNKKSEKISRLLKQQMGLDVSPTDIASAIAEMSLSDVINLYSAIDTKDKDAIKQMFSKNIKLEYGIQNRTQLGSVAQNRPEPAKAIAKPVGSLTPTELNAKKELDAKSDPKLAKEIKDKEEELETIKRLAGIK